MAQEFAPAPQPPSAPYVPTPPGSPRPRRLTRSSRERMWAGVAGGMAEYFDLDPALVRLMWVAAAVVSGGLAVPVYILAWVILPRDDRASSAGPHAWHETSRAWRAPEPTEPIGSEPGRDPASDKGAPGAYSSASLEQAWWYERDVERQHHRGRHPRSTGIVLVALGVLLLAANSGFLRLVDWHLMWPMIFIGLGVILLARQSRWGR